MKNCKKCDKEFETQKGLINYCSLKCRNSRVQTEVNNNKRSEILKNRKHTKSIENKDNKLCDYGCGNIASFLYENGKYCCSEVFNKCTGVINKIKKDIKFYDDNNSVVNCVSGIYLIKNKINNDCYVGSAFNLKRRKAEHFWLLRINKHKSIILQRSFNKYGEKNFEFLVIQCVENVNDLIINEQFWINELKPRYNILKTAYSRIGCKHTEETKKKISESQKGKVGNWLGKKHKPETIDKMKKVKRTEKHKEAISKAHKGRIISEEQRLKISNTLKNRKK